MLERIITALGIRLIEKLVGAILFALREWNEDRKAYKNLKKKVTELKESNTPDEIRAALRNFNL